MVYIVKMKKIAACSILIASLLLFPTLHAAAVTPFSNLEATCAVLAEVDSGIELFGKNADKRHPADALARAVTLLLAVSACENDEVDMSEIVEMTESAMFDIGSRSTTQHISPGEEMTLLDLMYCAFIGSANEACNLVAEFIAGSVSRFVTQMNEQARAIGCENTRFTNTHGQYSETQYTTAHDQFLIYREAISHPLFLEISGTYRYTTAETNMSEPRKLTNPNSLLNSTSKYYYRHCVSGLTSETYEGGYSFVAYAESEDLKLISVVLGSDVIMFEDQSALMRNLSESSRLLEWGFTSFRWRTILSVGDLVAKAPVVHGDGSDSVNLHPETPLKLLLDNDIPDDEFVRSITIYSEKSGEPLYAPIESGEVLGEITITRSGEKYGPILLLANTSIDLHRFQYIKAQILEVLSSKMSRTILAILFILFAGYIALVIRYNVLRRRRLRRIAEKKRKLIEESRNKPRD